MKRTGMFILASVFSLAAAGCDQKTVGKLIEIGVDMNRQVKQAQMDAAVTALKEQGISVEPAEKGVEDATSLTGLLNLPSGDYRVGIGKKECAVTVTEGTGGKKSVVADCRAVRR